MFNKILKWFLLVFGILGGIGAALLYQYNSQAVVQTKPVSHIGSPVTQPARSAGSHRSVHIHPGNGNVEGGERF